MKSILATLLFALFGLSASGQAVDSMQVQIDSIEATLKYQHGVIQLKNGIGTLKVPDGFKYLDADQSNYVLSDLWGNPKSESSLGMIIPDSMGVLGEHTWAFNVQYDEIGYVKDDDAGDIDYNELLAEMQNDTREASKERIKEGYEAIELVGWAAKPYYDADRKILHWAKELKFGESTENTLNYNVRILGRKGVLVLNAIASMNELPEVNKNIDKVLNIVTFSDGNKYADFNPSVDEVAAWTVGGLVAGKVMAKAGFFVVLLKFWKVIAMAVVGAGSFAWRLVTGRSKDTEETAGGTTA
jgi:uncharacterized membrane-anchored protein